MEDRIEDEEEMEINKSHENSEGDGLSENELENVAMGEVPEVIYLVF